MEGISAYIEKNGEAVYPMRTLSDSLKISGTAIGKCLETLVADGLIDKNEDVLKVTEKGLEALEPYIKNYYFCGRCKDFYGGWNFPMNTHFSAEDAALFLPVSAQRC